MGSAQSCLILALLAPLSALGARAPLGAARIVHARPVPRARMAQADDDGAGERERGANMTPQDMRSQLQDLRAETIGAARATLARAASERMDQLLRFKDTQLAELGEAFKSSRAREERNSKLLASAIRDAEQARADAVVQIAGILRSAADQIERAQGDAAVRVATADRDAAARVEAAETGAAARVAATEADAAARIAAAKADAAARVTAVETDAAARIAVVESNAAAKQLTFDAQLAQLESALAELTISEREAKGRLGVMSLSAKRLDNEVHEMRKRTAELGEQVRALLSAKNSLEDALEYAQDDLRSSTRRALEAETDATNSQRRFQLATARADKARADLEAAQAREAQLQWTFDEYRFDVEKISRARLARKARLATRADLNAVEVASNRRALAKALKGFLYRWSPSPVRKVLRLSPATVSAAGAMRPSEAAAEEAASEVELSTTAALILDDIEAKTDKANAAMPRKP